MPHPLRVVDSHFGPFEAEFGHAPEMLEDSEYVDFSPTEQLAEVIHHICPRSRNVNIAARVVDGAGLKPM
jgi:hypothetical protein